MTPKSLLRHPSAFSPIADFTGGTSQASFEEIIEDPVQDGETSTICFCSGKIYYDLRSAIDKTGTTGIRLVRIEQLYPFPLAGVEAVLGRKTGAYKVCWVQEEPRNRGAWTFVRDRFSRFMDVDELLYIGRGESASTATGSHSRHMREHEAIVREVLEKGISKDLDKRGTGRVAPSAAKLSREINNGIRSSHEP
jgi:2-oxoglutarate dehydrogenase E1 component